MSGTTIRRNASTSASAFASCRGPAFRTGSAAHHSGCYGPCRSPSPPFWGEREGPGRGSDREGGGGGARGPQGGGGGGGGGGAGAVNPNFCPPHPALSPPVQFSIAELG